MNHRGTETQRDPTTEKIIGAAIEVHRVLGPGLLESVYEECLAYELSKLQIEHVRQFELPILYKEVKLTANFRIDFVVEKSVAVELKTVEQLSPIHEAQLLTYMKLGQYATGLLINFNVATLKLGIKRMKL